MIISLLGYMGSGKTHISTNLSQKINFKFVDLDSEISRKINKTIPEIFAERGEIYFRRLEKEVLEEILDLENDIVLSLGGGTPAYYNNMQIINDITKSVFLRANISTLVMRLLAEKDSRPIIANISEEDLPEFVAKHLFERNVFYSQAHYTITTDSKSPEEVAEEITKLIFL